MTATVLIEPFKTGHAAALVADGELQDLFIDSDDDRPARFSGVCRERNAVLARVPKRSDVVVDHIARSVRRNVEACHVRAAELSHQLHRFEALRLGVETQRAEDDPRFDARVADSLGNCCIHTGHDLAG